MAGCEVRGGCVRGAGWVGGGGEGGGGQPGLRRKETAQPRSCEQLCAAVRSPGSELGSIALRLTATDRIVVIDVALLKDRVPAALGRRHHLGDGDALELP